MTEREAKATETCPQCQGIPEHSAVLCGPKRTGDEEMGCRMTTLTCDFCGGFGIVEVKIAARYRQGRQLRDMRVKAWMTQRELAGMLQISPITLNDYECGRLEKLPGEPARQADVLNWLPQRARR